MYAAEWILPLLPLQWYSMCGRDYYWRWFGRCVWGCVGDPVFPRKLLQIDGGPLHKANVSVSPHGLNTLACLYYAWWITFVKTSCTLHRESPFKKKKERCDETPLGVRQRRHAANLVLRLCRSWKSYSWAAVWTHWSYFIHAISKKLTDGQLVNFSPKH